METAKDFLGLTGGIKKRMETRMYFLGLDWGNGEEHGNAPSIIF